MCVFMEHNIWKSFSWQLTYSKTNIDNDFFHTDGSWNAVFAVDDKCYNTQVKWHTYLFILYKDVLLHTVCQCYV